MFWITNLAVERREWWEGKTREPEAQTTCVVALVQEAVRPRHSRSHKDNALCLRSCLASWESWQDYNVIKVHVADFPN